MTGSEYHAEELKRREEKKHARQEQHIKSEKLLTLASRISEHDLNSKIARCVKWLEKLHEVRVVISGGDNDMQKIEKIAAAIEKEAATVAGRTLQKRVKDGVMKFSIMPTIKKQSETQSEESDKKQNETPPPKPADTNKKLLDAPPSPEVQQVRSLHSMALLSHLTYQQHQAQPAKTGRISTKCSKCENEKVTSRRVKITAIVGFLLLAKYGFWSFVYSSLNR